MALHPSYGVFLNLPSELRELIWLEFIPVAQDTPSPATETSAQVDLRVLRASKCLYEEISTVLYSKNCLHFDLSPCFYGSVYLWCTVSFRMQHSDGTAERSQNNNMINGRPCAMWRLEAKPGRRDTRFNNFPFHKLAALQVSMSAPDPDAPGEFYRLWRDVMHTVQLFKDAKVLLPPVTIQLNSLGTCDWDGYVGSVWETEEKNSYDTVTIPFFYTLPNVKSVRVKPHSDELRDKMDWKMINFANSVVSKRAAAGCTAEINLSEERELWSRVFRDYLWMRRESCWKRRFHRVGLFVDPIIYCMKEEWIYEAFEHIIEEVPPLTSRKISRPRSPDSFGDVSDEEDTSP